MSGFTKFYRVSNDKVISVSNVFKFLFLKKRLPCFQLPLDTAGIIQDPIYLKFLIICIRVTLIRIGDRNFWFRLITSPLYLIYLV